MDPILDEYRRRVMSDGLIVITDDVVIKIKEKCDLTVDLLYDADHHIFLDANNIVYVHDSLTPSIEIQNLTILPQATTSPSPPVKKRQKKTHAATVGHEEKKRHIRRKPANGSQPILLDICASPSTKWDKMDTNGG